MPHVFVHRVIVDVRARASQGQRVVVAAPNSSATMLRPPSGSLVVACVCLLVTATLAARSPTKQQYTASAQADRITNLPGLAQAPDFGAMLAQLRGCASGGRLVHAPQRARQIV